MLTTEILIFCTCHFWSSSLCLCGFCLQVSSESNFRPDTRGQKWCLLWVPVFSRAAGREGHCRQMSLACVGSTRIVPATLGLLPLAACVLSRLHCPGSGLLYRERALSCVRFQFSGPPQRCRFGWACILSLLHPSSSGSQEFDRRTLPGCGAPSPLRGPSLSFHEHQSGVPCVCSGELVSSRNPSSRCQPSRISGSLWLETGSLFAIW